MIPAQPIQCGRMRGSYSFLVLDHLILCLNMLFTQQGANTTLLPHGQNCEPRPRRGRAQRERGLPAGVMQCRGLRGRELSRSSQQCTHSDHTIWGSHFLVLTQRSYTALRTRRPALGGLPQLLLIIAKTCKQLTCPSGGQ